MNTQPFLPRRSDPVSRCDVPLRPRIAADAKISYSAISRSAGRAMKLILPGMLLIAVSPARADHIGKTFQGGRAPGNHASQSQWRGGREGLDEAGSNGDRHARHRSGGSGRHANWKPRRYHDPPSFRRRSHRFRPICALILKSAFRRTPNFRFTTIPALSASIACSAT